LANPEVFNSTSTDINQHPIDKTICASDYNNNSTTTHYKNDKESASSLTPSGTDNYYSDSTSQLSTANRDTIAHPDDSDSTISSPNNSSFSQIQNTMSWTMSFFSPRQSRASSFQSTSQTQTPLLTPNSISTISPYRMNTPPNNSYKPKSYMDRYSKTRNSTNNNLSNDFVS
jgi:hypothetical protein